MSKKVYVNSQMFAHFMNQAALTPTEFKNKCNGKVSLRTIHNLAKAFECAEVTEVEKILCQEINSLKKEYLSICQSPLDSLLSNRAEALFLSGVQGVSDYKCQLLKRTQQKLISLTAARNAETSPADFNGKGKLADLLGVIADQLVEKNGALHFQWYLIFDPTRHQKQKFINDTSAKLKIFQDASVQELVDVRVVEGSPSGLFFDFMICDSKHVVMSMLQSAVEIPAFALGFANTQLALRLTTWCDKQVSEVAIKYEHWSRKGAQKRS